MSDRNGRAGIVERLLADWPLAAWDGVHMLAAVSGGADSMAMLRALIEAKSNGRGAGRLIVGHVNHQLRGAESNADEHWLRRQCERLHVPLEVRRGDARDAAAAASDGLEAAARTLRYKLLGEMAEEAGARFVATAHTRDDQAETVLFRVLRGSGLRGLKGIPRMRTISPSVTVVRPLLACGRDELRAYLAEREQPFRDDTSNADLAFARNRLRREALPYLREHVSPDVDAALVRVAEMAGEAQAVIERLAAELLKRATVEVSPRAIALRASQLANEAPLVTIEALRLAWRERDWPEQAMTHLWWHKLAEIAQTTPAATAINLPGNVLARRVGDVVELRAAGA